MEEVQTSYVLWFESEMLPTGSGVWTLGLRLVVLFWKVLEPLGGGA